MDKTLADDLIAMERRDLETHARLVKSGVLFGGYHPEMRAVNEANADRLMEIAARVGWPDETLVGADAARAAWRILQHAVSRPDTMRRGEALLADAVRRGAAPAWQLAMLTDRIRVLEGRPQVYGTQFDWDAAGRMAPRPIEDEAGVDARRAALGMNTLAQRTAEMHAQAIADGETPPTDWAARQLAADRWAAELGWRGGPGS